MKFCLFFLAVGIVMMQAILSELKSFVLGVYLEHYTESLLNIAEITTRNFELTPEEIAYYATTGEEDEKYRKAREQFVSIRDGCGLESLYIIYPTGYLEAIWFMDASGEYSEALGNPVTNYADEDSEAFRQVYETGDENVKPDITEVTVGDEVKNVVSVYYPIKGGDGSTIAVLGVDEQVDKFLTQISVRLGMLVIFIFLLILAVTVVQIVFVQFAIVRAIYRLKDGVQRIADGELGVQVKSRRRDEIGDITRVFNRMSVSIERHVAEMEELNGAYRKFIPSEIFGILKRKSIVELKLGDQANIAPTVLFMEPRDAKRRLPGQTSEQIFRYINEVMELIVPAAIGQGGAVWHFEKAGVCSFFQENAQSALDAAIEADRNLGKKGEKLSAGIVKGPVMVGIAGHEQRMDIVSISEQVETAQFLMEIGERYHASVLIGRSAALQISEFDTSYHIRFLGYIRLEASERIEGVYDVYDGDGDEDRRLKKRTKERFEEGVLLFSQQNYERAREAFIDVLREYRRDDASREYLCLCNQILGGEKAAGQVWFAEWKKGNE